MLFNTDYFLNTIEGLVRTETERVVEISSEREKQIEGFLWAVEKRVSVRSASCSVSIQTSITGERTDEQATLVRDSHEKERQRRKVKNQDRCTTESANLKNRNLPISPAKSSSRRTTYFQTRLITARTASVNKQKHTMTTQRTKSTT